MLKIIKMEYFQQNYNKSCQFSFCHTTQNMNKTFFLMPLTISAASVQLVAKNQIIEKKTPRSSFSVMCVFYAVFFTITIANVHMNSQVGVLDLDLWHIPYMPPTSADCGLVRSLLAGWWVGWWAGWPTSLLAWLAVSQWGALAGLFVDCLSISKWMICTHFRVPPKKQVTHCCLTSH